MDNRKLWGLVALCLALAGAFAAGLWAQTAPANRVIWRWPDSMDAQNAAPKNHRVLFQNDHVLLLEVTVEPGETEKVHGHKFASVFMYDAVQPHLSNHTIADDKHHDEPRRYENSDWYQPECRAMGPEAPHQVTDLDTFPQHFYRMEFKKMDGKSIESVKYLPQN